LRRKHRVDAIVRGRGAWIVGRVRRCPHLHTHRVVQFWPSQLVGSTITATLPDWAHSWLAAACAWA
jgi:hypothetical protein